MLNSLSIKNFTIIDNLEIEFDAGLSIITGETGAGKSIFVGALSLILGNRAELSQLKDKSKKCIIEAVFNINNQNVISLFTENDIDFENQTIIRREILPTGKSRAFVNDTPVNLSLLKSIGLNLIDVHSQHQSLMIGDNMFQLMVIDEVADLNPKLKEFRMLYNQFVTEESNLLALISKANKSKKDHDYLQFQFNQLYDAKLSNPEEIIELETQLNELIHAEDTKQNLQGLSDQLNNDEVSALNILNTSLNILSRVKGNFGKGDELYSRIKSVEIEVKDIAEEIDTLLFEIEFDPNRIEILTERLDLINSLLQKNQLSTIEELINLRESLDNKILEIDSFDDRILKQQEAVTKLSEEVANQAGSISKNRLKVLPETEKRVIELLHKLGMPSARFGIQRVQSPEITSTGCDNISFLFSASRKGEMQEIAKVASGGELSRLMLCIKSLIAKSANLNTIVFDEIDTGVSGEIADKVGNIIKDISSKLQVINITHLPQVAVKGDKHFRIFKVEEEEGANTYIELLNNENRVQEIAKMLSGSGVSEAAIENARILLG